MPPHGTFTICGPWFTRRTIDVENCLAPAAATINRITALVEGAVEVAAPVDAIAACGR